MTDDRPAQRASDQDREHVVERLREAAADGRLDLAEFDDRMAQAYAARTRPELEPLLVDLPDPGRDGSSLAPASHPEVARIGGTLSSTHRRGAWDVPRRLDVHLFMGSTCLDLTTARVPEHVEIGLGVVLSSVEIIVPPDSHVHTDEVRNVLSSVSDRARRISPASATIEIHGYATLSSVTIKTPNVIAQWWRSVTDGR